MQEGKCMLTRVMKIVILIVKNGSKERKTVTEEKQENNETQPQKAADDEEANMDMFSWSDDEIQLLLMATLDFKPQCELEGMDWESKRSKYEQILDLMK